MTISSQNVSQRIKADWTWTGTSFEKDVIVSIADGKIASVEKQGTTDGVQCIAGALLPGFVNAHSHAFQRLLRGKGEVYNDNDKNNTFWGWRSEMYKLVETLNATEFKAACVLCFNEMLDAGITCVGEFHYFHHGEVPYEYDQLVIEAAEEVGIRLVLLNAYYEYSACGKQPLSEPQKRFETNDLSSYWKHLDSLSGCERGVVAHSIRAVDPVELVQLVAGARERGLPFHMHVEEQVPEIDQCKAAYENRTPLRVLLDLGVPLDHVTLVHCTHSEPDEMQEFISKGGTVCVCPLTEAALADGLPDVEPMQGNISLGTDCNARIDFIEEMRWLEYGQRVKTHRRGSCCRQGKTWVGDLPAELLRYATQGGAKSLKVEAGAIEPGLLADFCVLEVDSEHADEMLATAIFGDATVKGVCVAGRWVRPATVNTDCIMHTASVPPDSVGSKRVKRSDDAEGALASELVNRVIEAGEDVIALACALIDIDSTSGQEQLMATAISAWLMPRGWTVIKQPVGDRFNLHCVRTNGDPDNTVTPRLYFNTHMDVVPPWFPSKIDDTNLYGRGACDTKSLIAAMLIASQTLTNDNASAVGLLFVVSEETTHEGMIAANDLTPKLNPEFLIVGEPTDAKVILMQKGILKCRITAKGVAAHSGYPHLGHSAIDDMISLLTRIQGHGWPSSDTLGQTSVNVGLIAGGQAVNALAEECTSDLLFRLISSPESILGVVEKMCREYENITVQVLTKNDPVDMTYMENLVTGFAFGVASFNTDIPYLKFDGRAVLYGHGSITDAHCPREYIGLDDLISLVPAYEKLAMQLLSL